MINKKVKVSNPNIGSERLQKALRGYSISRRNFLVGMITSLIAVTLLIAVTFFPLSCLPSGQAQPSRVDVHCHIFNARDLPLEGIVKKFLKDIIKMQNPNSTDFLIQIITDALVGNILSETYDYVTEDGELDQLPGGGTPPSCVDLVSSGTPIIGLLEDWVALLKQPRYQIACKLIETYQDIDLFTPAFLDTDDWLPDKAETTVEEQMKLYEKIIRLYKGKIHPLVAFDPMSEVHYSEIPGYQSLKWVKEAVEERGFIGVKVYPPMGFFPINNVVHDQGNANSQEIDDALRSLYGWCIDKDVPIMAHCDNSNAAQPGYEERANPKYWEEVLEEYQNLRLNLGHFGGANSVIAKTGWAWKIAELMENPGYPHVYADTGYHDVVLPGGAFEAFKAIVRQLYIHGLDVLYNTYPKAKEHLMYGSDWHMITVLDGHKEYANKFEEIFDDNFPNVKADFFGKNALRFFGLDGTNPLAIPQNQQRLLTFYEKHCMTEKPNWWIGNWWTQNPQNPPSTPTNLQATVTTTSQIDLFWDASTCDIVVAGYNIYRNGAQIDTTTGTIFSDSGLSPTTTYTYTVSAFDAVGNESSQSISASATTQ